MRVAAPAERGRANEALLDLLAGALSVSRSRVTLVAGAASREKVVRLDGLEPGEVERRLSLRLRRENT